MVAEHNALMLWLLKTTAMLNLQGLYNEIECDFVHYLIFREILNRVQGAPTPESFVVFTFPFSVGPNHLQVNAYLRKWHLLLSVEHDNKLKRRILT